MEGGEEEGGRKLRQKERGGREGRRVCCLCTASQQTLAKVVECSGLRWKGKHPQEKIQTGIT